MSKAKPKRVVTINEGWGPQDHYERARVIDSRKVNSLFGGIPSEELLVELAGGERKWVSYWKEDPPNDQATEPTHSHNL